MIRALLWGVQLHRVFVRIAVPEAQDQDLGAAPSWASPSSSLCLTFLLHTMTPALSCPLYFETMVRFDNLTYARVAHRAPRGSCRVFSLLLSCDHFFSLGTNAVGIRRELMVQ